MRFAKYEFWGALAIRSKMKKHLSVQDSLFVKQRDSNITVEKDENKPFILDRPELRLVREMIATSKI